MGFNEQQSKFKARLNIPEGIKSMTAKEYRDLIDGIKPAVANKYHNVLTDVNGIRFDSRKEANRYQQLLLMKEKGMIIKFERQVKYVLIPGVKKLFREKSYYADFVVTYPNGIVEVEDVKGGIRLPVYKLKKHLMYEKYKILIKEI